MIVIDLSIVRLSLNSLRITFVMCDLLNSKVQILIKQRLKTTYNLFIYLFIFPSDTIKIDQDLLLICFM